MNRTRSDRWIAGLAACLLLITGTAGAGFLSTRSALPSFHFSGDTVTYDLGATALTLADDDSGSMVSFGGGATRDPSDPLRGGLFISERQGGAGNIKRANVALFGSIPSAASRSDVERIEDGISAMDVDKRDDVLAFLVDQRPTTGPLVGRMQIAGIFMTVPGVDLAVWVHGYEDDAPAQQLLALEDDVREGRVSAEALAIPLPGSLALLLLGLPFALRR
jgi:hypothetical protein